jgi:hypothetical protein
MDKEYIYKLAQDPRFIPGIYNYCDRWCEKCPFTERCMTFALSEKHFEEPQAKDINNELFWEKLSEMFKVTLDMVKQDAMEQGIDLEAIDTASINQEHEAERNIAENHDCSVMAKTYSEMVKDWFDSAQEFFNNKANDLSLKVQIELPESNPQAEAMDLKDAVDNIRWYQHQIYVKLCRAVTSALEEEKENDEIKSRDSDGSVKVSLIGIDRSIDAWDRLCNHFPEQQDNILNILAHLDRLRKKVEKTFPNARKFVRPGFDVPAQEQQQ